jgi:hypothetical protein
MCCGRGKAIKGRSRKTKLPKKIKPIKKEEKEN